MERYRLYNTQDIDQLKEKLATYKDTLMSLKGGEAIDDYLLTKREIFSVKKQLSKFEGVMKKMEEYQGRQITDYEQEVENISAQIQSVNTSVDNLKQDVNMIMDKLNLLLSKPPAPKQEDKEELHALKEELQSLKQQVRTETESAPQASYSHNRRPSSYNQLRNMIHTSRQIQLPPGEKKTGLTNKSSYDYGYGYGRNSSQHVSSSANKQGKNINNARYKGNGAYSEWELNRNIMRRPSKGKKNDETDNGISPTEAASQPEVKADINESSNHEIMEKNSEFEAQQREGITQKTASDAESESQPAVQSEETKTQGNSSPQNHTEHQEPLEQTTDKVKYSTDKGKDKWEINDNHQPESSLTAKDKDSFEESSEAPAKDEASTTKRIEFSSLFSIFQKK